MAAFALGAGTVFQHGLYGELGRIDSIGQHGRR